MTLRKQTLIFFCISLLCLFLVLLVGMTIVFKTGFARVEQDETRDNVNRVSEVVSDETTLLAQIQQDWAQWDDAYQFVTDNNPNFIKANLNAPTLARLRLRLITFINTGGEVVFSTGLDLTTGDFSAVPDGFQTYLAPGSPLFNTTDITSKTSGILLVDENPLLVVASPILNSDGQGPSHGTLIMARSLNADSFKTFSNRLHLPLQVLRYDSANLPSDFQQARAAVRLADPLPIFIQPLSEQTNAGYLVLKDIANNPALILRIEVNRDIYQQSQTGQQFLIILIVVSCVIFGGITLFLMERMLLRRITNLNAEVQHIGASGNLDATVTVSGKDEVASLAQVINQMLVAVSQSQANERESEKRFRLLIERLSVGVMLQGPDRQINLANQAAIDLLGLPDKNLQDEMVRLAQWKCISEDGTDIPAEERPLQKTLRTKKPMRNVTMGVYRAKYDDWGWFLINTEPLLDDNGNITNVICSFSDITERRKVEQLKTEFISIVSHELRTPLTSIVGSLGLVVNGVAGEIAPGAKTMLEIANKNSERLVRLINDILDIEKIESGKMVFHKKPLSLVPLVEQAMADTRSYAEQFGVVFEFEGEKSAYQVMTDSDRLTQVLVNLLSNAAKFSPPGEKVKVSVGRLDDHTVRVSVSDKGPGISEEFQGRIFQKFAQADSSDTRQKGGTGLGLSISKAIMEKLKGNLDFTTVVGQGSTFFVDLPLLQTPAGKVYSLPGQK